MPIRENEMRKNFKIGNSGKYDARENIVSYSKQIIKLTLEKF